MSPKLCGLSPRLACAAGFLIASGIFSVLLLSSWILQYFRQHSAGPKVHLKVILEKPVLSRLACPVDHDDPYKFPELNFFDLQPGCTLQCKQPRILKAYSLQYAMRLCLASSSCVAFQWDEALRSVQLCNLLPSNVSGHHWHGALKNGPVFAAVRKQSVHTLDREAGQGLQKCSEGEVLILGRRSGTCSVCKEGYCSVLPSARLVPDVNMRVEKAIRALFWREIRYRGFNPSMAAQDGQNYFIVRSANYTLCPGYAGAHAHHSSPPFSSQNLLCRTNRAMQPYNCVQISIPTSKLHVPMMEAAKDRWHRSLSTSHRGLEDARGFSWNGRLHLMGTLNLAKSSTSKHALSKVAVVRLTRDMARMDYGAVLNCPGMHWAQKNYMPLVVNGTLYVVVMAYPLTIGRVDPVTLECTLVQKASRAAISLQAVLPSSAHLSGGSTFVPLGAYRYLALAHHYIKTVSHRVYLHHFVIVSARKTSAGHHAFALDWVSDAFRLPNGPGEEYGVQFATGLLLRNSSLYISYGISDCFVGLAQVPDITTKLQLWEKYGIGSQSR